MASIDENERDDDSTVGDDEQEYEEYTAWEPPYERYFHALDTASNVSKWTNMLPQSYVDTVSAVKHSVENILPLHQIVANDFHRDLGAMMSALDHGASLRAITSGLDDAVRQHDQMMTALGYIKVRRRRYAQPTPSRPRIPLPTAAHPTSPLPTVEACEPDVVTVTPQKRGRGRQPGHRTIDPMHFDRLMCAYCVEKGKTPSRREFQVFAAMKYKTVDRRRLSNYAKDFKTDWQGVRLLYGQRFGVE